MRRAEKQFAYFCFVFLSIFVWLSNGDPEIDTRLSDNKMGCLGMPFFRALMLLGM